MKLYYYDISNLYIFGRTNYNFNPSISCVDVFLIYNLLLKVDELLAVELRYPLGTLLLRSERFEPPPTPPSRHQLQLYPIIISPPHLQIGQPKTQFTNYTLLHQTIVKMPPPSPLAIATSSLQRLVKEEASYYKELEKQEERLKKIEASTEEDENREYTLKQEVSPLQPPPTLSISPTFPSDSQNSFLVNLDSYT